MERVGSRGTPHSGAFAAAPTTKVWYLYKLAQDFSQRFDRQHGEQCVPTAENRSEQKWFDSLLKELTDQFGGATGFLRAPGKGLWKNGGEVKQDNVAVIEVMTRDLNPVYWAKLRGRLEHDLSQEEIVIRAEEIMRL